MSKLKTLEIVCTGRRYDHYLKQMVPFTKTTTVEVTGSRLSIRRAEDKTVSAFITDHNLGSAGLKSKLIE